MSQHDQNIANDTGANVRADINAALAAIFGQSSGTSAPGTTIAYQLWADTTNALLKQRNAANSGWIAKGSLDETFLLSRTSNTILGISDIGKTIVITSGTFSQTFTAAATLADGWYVNYYNFGSGVVTLDPNSSENINGATTLVLNPGVGGQIRCNGSAFYFIGSAFLTNYLESTFTPNFGAVTATYNSQTGRYTRSGNLIFAEISLDVSSLDTADTSTNNIAGIPTNLGNAGFVMGSIDPGGSTLLTIPTTGAFLHTFNTGSTSLLQIRGIQGTQYAYNSGVFNSSGILKATLLYRV